MNTGTSDERGFIPPEPAFNAILDQMAKGIGGWDKLNSSAAGKHLQDENSMKKERDKLRARYLSFAKDYPDVVEDLLGRTLRCAPCNPTIGNIELMTAFALERQGQNGLMTYILNMVHLGVESKNSQAKTTKKKK